MLSLTWLWKPAQPYPFFPCGVSHPPGVSTQTPSRPAEAFDTRAPALRHNRESDIEIPEWPCAAMLVETGPLVKMILRRFSGVWAFVEKSHSMIAQRAPKQAVHPTSNNRHFGRCLRLNLSPAVPDNGI